MTDFKEIRGLINWGPLLEFLPISIMAGIGWMAHTIVTKREDGFDYDWRYLLAGVAMSGFVAWCILTLMLAMKIDYGVSAVTAAMLGASGEKGYSALLERVQNIFNGGGSNNGKNK